ncbi:MAG: hypothetical protein IKI20_01585 [Lachnospiraceae bacterium]|nr:hypothetical protein [Lachnospiraceae bacterium]
MSNVEKRVNYSEQNTGNSPDAELAGVLKAMTSSKNPPNRIYDAMIQQVDLLRFEFSRKKGSPIKQRDVENLNEKFATINKLAEIYLKSKDNRKLGSEETKQVETVYAMREVLSDQSRYLSKNVEFAKDGATMGESKPATPESAKEAAKEGGMEYSDAMRKSSEAAFSAMRELGVLSASKKSGEEFTQTEKDLTRLGMTAIMLCDRIMAGEEGQKFFETYVKPQKDYGKVISSIANSTELKQSVADKYTGDKLKEFLMQKDAPKKLWDDFEQKVKKPKDLKAEEQKQNLNQKEKTTGFSL